MDNREVMLPNPTTLKTDSKLVFSATEEIMNVVDKGSLQGSKEITNLDKEVEIKLPSDESVSKMETENMIDNHDNPKEIMMGAKKIFVEEFENASIEQKQTAITQFYSALDAVYGIRYRGAPVSIIFSESGGYVFNQDGFIRIPLDTLDKQTPDGAVYSVLHEYRHAMQPSLNVKSSGMGLPTFTRLSHDMLTEEIDATKFAFANMDSLDLDKTKIDHYNDWQKAIRITDAFDLLKQNYNQETADNMLDIYKLLDEYTLQTTRSDLMSDGIRGKFDKIQTKIRFRSNITTAKAKFTELEKIAKSTNDSSLLKVVSEVRTDWPQFHL
jgi:hypothetical protein